MSQASHRLRLTESTNPLPGLPNGPLSAQQQLDALRRAQTQADQRVQLGMQLFKATEAQTEQQQILADELRREQTQLREKVQQDVSRSLRSYDQWVGRMDDGFAEAMHNFDERLEKLRNEWSNAQRRIDQMMKRSEALLEQNRLMHAPLKSHKRPISTVSVAPASPQAASTPSAETRDAVPLQADIPRSPVKPDEGSAPICGELLRRLRKKSEGEKAPSENVTNSNMTG